MTFRLALVGSQAFSLLNFRREFILCAVERGWQVYALAPDHTPASRSTLQAWGAHPLDYPLSRAGQNPFDEARTVWALWRVFRLLKPDAVLAYFIKPVVDALCAARLAGVKGRFALIEGRGRGLDPQAGAARARLLQGLLRVALHGSQGVFFLNTDDQRFFEEHGLCSARQARFLGPIGLDLTVFAHAPLPEKTAPCVVMAARLLRSKGVELFVQAAHTLKAHHPHARFVLLGGPDANPDSISAEQLHAWQKAGVVECPGPVADVRPWLAQACVFVLPSFYPEGVPRSLQEALATGRPIITTDTPGCRDLVCEGQTGCLIPPHDVHALETAIEGFLLAPHKTSDMGQKARAYAEQHLDSFAIQRRFLSEIDKAMRA